MQALSPVHVSYWQAQTPAPQECVTLTRVCVTGPRPAVVPGRTKAGKPPLKPLIPLLRSWAPPHLYSSVRQFKGLRLRSAIS
jgi:hypothetical protein